MGIKLMSTRSQAIPSGQKKLQYKIIDLHKNVIMLSERSIHSLEHPKKETTEEVIHSAKRQLVDLLAQLDWYIKER